MSQNGTNATVRTLYCGNISEKVTEDLLYELFQQAGPLESVTIAKDKEGNRRNFGFITFKDAVSVDYTSALMKGVSLFGKTLRLQRRTGAESDSNPYMEQLINYVERAFCYSPNIGQSPHHGPSPGTNRKHQSETKSYGEERRRHRDSKGDKFYADSNHISDQSPSHYGHPSSPYGYDNGRSLGMSEKLPYTPSPQGLDYNNGRGSGDRYSSKRNLDAHPHQSRNSFGHREDLWSPYSPSTRHRDNEENGGSFGRNGDDFRERSSFGSTSGSPYERPEYSSRHGYEHYDHRSSDRASRDRVSQRSGYTSTLRNKH